MDPFSRVSRILWILLRSLPPISWGRLLMPAVFAGSWTVLTHLGAEHATAFVWSAVLAQAAHLYAVLPVSTFRQRQAFGRASSALKIAMLVGLTLFALQIWLGDPLVSQRLVSGNCALYIGAMLLGLSGDRIFLDRFAPVRDGSDVPLAFRRHLLRLYALTALLVLIVNESLIATAMPIGTRVAVLSVLPLVLFYLFEIMLRLTAPPLDEQPR